MRATKVRFWWYCERIEDDVRVEAMLYPGGGDIDIDATTADGHEFEPTPKEQDLLYEEAIDQYNERLDRGFDTWRDR